MITVFCNRLGWFNLELLVNQFHSRLMFGVQRQLLDLVRIKLLNSHRARLFYNAGFTTVASLAMCDLKKIEKILRASISFGHGTRNDTESNSKLQSNQLNSNSEAVIWSETKGYTYWEASVVILKEASELLKNDLELMGVKIKSEKMSDKLNKTSNKTMFDFNETFDSMIQTQKNIQDGLKESVDKIDDRIVENQDQLKPNDLIEEKFVLTFNYLIL
jgi:DNA polymerase theta